jgi:hypothetical protein
MSNNNSGAQNNMGFAVSGATTRVAADTQALQFQRGGSQGPVSGQLSATFFVTGLNPGSTTFTAKYDVNAGTGTFANRTILVIPIS